MKKRAVVAASVVTLFAAVAMAAGTPASAPQPAAQISPATQATAAPLYSLADLYSKGADLHTKRVSVRGRVVKVTSGIMGKIWTHIQDGTGDKSKGTNDVISISAKDKFEVGDVVTVTGTVNYNPESRYKLVLDDATLKQ